MRVAGTPEARKAWLALRGPFFCAYLALAIIAISITPITQVGWVWRAGIIICSLAAVAGSFASWCIAGRGRNERWLTRVEALEVTGVRLIAILEFAYATLIWFAIHPPLSYVALHVAVGFLMLGIVGNMTWHRGRVAK